MRLQDVLRCRQTPSLLAQDPESKTEVELQEALQCDSVFWELNQPNGRNVGMSPCSCWGVAAEIGL
jgi:hypothetical protein